MIDRTRAVVEGFEPRRLFTAAWVDQGVLHVTGGDGRGDTIVIYLTNSEDEKTLTGCRVRINARKTVSFPADQIDAINVRGGGGNDLILCEGDGFLFPTSEISFTAIGGRGNDTLHGAGFGDVLLRGNGGNDTLMITGSGSTTRGRIDGGGGHDIISGSKGADLITAGGTVPSEADIINGSDGNDTIFGGNFRDVISGGDGNDVIFGGAGDDSIDAGIGDDAVFAGAGNDTVMGNAGNDRLLGNAGDDHLYGADTVTGSASGGGLDSLYGGTGTDVLQGSLGVNITHHSELPNLTAVLDYLRTQVPADVQDLVTA